jgi:hypothetical protein
MIKTCKIPPEKKQALDWRERQQKLQLLLPRHISPSELSLPTAFRHFGISVQSSKFQIKGKPTWTPITF